MVDRLVIVGSGALATFYAYEWSLEFDISVLGSWKESISIINSSFQKESSRKLIATSNWGNIYKKIMKNHPFKL